MVVTINRDIEHRCEWLADTMRRAQRRLNLSTQADMARAMGMRRTTFCHRLANPSAMTLRELWALESVLRHAGMTQEADTIRGGFTC